MVQPPTPNGHETDEQRLALASAFGLERAVSAFPADVLTAMASAARVQSQFRPCDDLTQELYPVAKQAKGA